MRVIRLLKSKKNAILDLVFFLLGGGVSLFLRARSIPFLGIHQAFEFIILGVASTGIFRAILPYSSMSLRKIREIDREGAEINRGAFTNRRRLRFKLLRATRLYHNNQFRRAQKILAKLRPLAKTDEEIFSTSFFSAMCCYKLGFYDDATELFLDCLEVKYDARVLTNLGSCYLMQDITDEAEHCFLEALDVGGNDPFSLNGLALTYARTERLDEALNCAKRSLTFEDAPYTSYSIAAYCSARLGMTDEGDEDYCERYFSRLLEVAPGYAKEFRSTLDKAKEK